MKIKGVLTENSLQIESVDFNQILKILEPILNKIRFSLILSANHKLSENDQEILGYLPRTEGEKGYAAGKTLRLICGEDRIFKASGNLILNSGEGFNFSFDQGVFQVEGTNLALIRNRIFPDLPFETGNFILKKGWFSTRIFLENGADEVFFIKTRKNLKKKTLRHGYIRELFLSLLPWLPLILTLIRFADKPLIFFPTLILYTLLIFLLKKNKKARYFEKTLCRN